MGNYSEKFGSRGRSFSEDFGTRRGIQSEVIEDELRVNADTNMIERFDGEKWVNAKAPPPPPKVRHIDVSGMSPKTAEQYINDIMKEVKQRYQNDKHSRRR